MLVVTIDQRSSSRQPDRVPALLAMLEGADGVDTVLAAERTVGDEVQLVVSDAASAVAVVEICTRLGGWTVGIGVGDVQQPLPTSTREARGPAFLSAREAVERAKRSPARVAVTGGADPYAAERSESALWLLVAVQGRRTERGWQVVDAVRRAGNQRAAAEELGVSVQSVSQVLRAAGHSEAERGRALATWLLEQLAEPPPTATGGADASARGRQR
jgi:hypothetical protein